MAKKKTPQQQSAARKRALQIKQRAAASKSGQHFSGFIEFIRQQGVVGLAIGLVLGLQVKALVDQFVASFINPLLGLVLPGSGSLSSKTLTITVASKSARFTYGTFLDVLISFVIVAAVIYMVYKVLRLEKLDKPK